MKRTMLITLVLGTVLAVAPAAHALVMSDGSPVSSQPSTVGTSDAAYRAEVVRGEALNRQYGNALTKMSPAQFKALYQAGGNRLAPQELVALAERGQALNSTYGTGAGPSVTLRPDILGGNGVSPSAGTILPANDGSSFPWAAALSGIALACAMILTLVFVATRRRHQPSF